LATRRWVGRIAGSEESVRNLPPDNLRAFWSSAYVPGNIVVSAAGDISHQEVVDLVREAFGSGDATQSAFAPAPELPAGDRVMSVRRDTTQAQLCLGVPGLRRDDPEAWTLEVLNAVLGDGMSSRLFQSVREEKGLAYDVSSYIVDYADAGAFVVTAGVDPDRMAPAVGAILDELARVREERSRTTKWPLRRPTWLAGWSCGWKKRATWPPGWAGRRPCMTGS